MDKSMLVSTARDLVVEGKGILAADESSRTIKRRLDSINVPSTEDNRRAYRELLAKVPKYPGGPLGRWFKWGGEKSTCGITKY